MKTKAFIKKTKSLHLSHAEKYYHRPNMTKIHDDTKNSIGTCLILRVIDVNGGL